MIGLIAVVAYWRNSSRTRRPKTICGQIQQSFRSGPWVHDRDPAVGLGIGVAEALITDLGGFKRIREAASAVFRYADSQPDPWRRVRLES